MKYISKVMCGVILMTSFSITVCASNNISYPVLLADYAELLTQYVDNDGSVNYSGIKKDRKKLDTTVEQLTKIDVKSFNTWSEKAKIAFWINTYNILTLKVIIDHYPIKPSFLMSMRYPKNSIRQIKGVWDKITFAVLDRRLTLNEIEHTILRKKFTEPRVHMAVVCASRGCPFLRIEPYREQTLDEQLDDQARRFLADTTKYYIDRENNAVYLSPIFKWFQEDFTMIPAGFKNTDKRYSGVIAFISKYLDPSDVTYLKTGTYNISFLDYDWSLNEQ